MREYYIGLVVGYFSCLILALIFSVFDAELNSFEAMSIGAVLVYLSVIQFGHERRRR